MSTISSNRRRRQSLQCASSSPPLSRCHKPLAVTAAILLMYNAVAGNHENGFPSYCCSAFTPAVLLPPISPSSSSLLVSNYRQNNNKTPRSYSSSSSPSSCLLWLSSKNDNDNEWDSNQWGSIDDQRPKRLAEEQSTDWEDLMQQKKDGTFWSTFDSSKDGEKDETAASSSSSNSSSSIVDEDQEAELWLDTLQSLSAEEVEFNLKEADRADKVFQMQEWGFDAATIQNTLGVEVDTSLEEKDEVSGMQQFRQESYLEEIDLETVESHTTVDVDDDTGEPVRSQMVYVDEHACIGCTNCAMIAQSTFFMHSEHGRARVFQQWGDDDETIQVAIETCPVDCIHYIPYDELVSLEKDRRNQNINFKARLVSQAENGNGQSHLVGIGSIAYTAPQQISGNMASRCSNCPTRGCSNCPMYGVGKNPQYEKREKARKAKLAKKKLQAQREREQKSAEL